MTTKTSERSRNVVLETRELSDITTRTKHSLPLLLLQESYIAINTWAIPSSFTLKFMLLSHHGELKLNMP